MTQATMQYVPGRAGQWAEDRGSREPGGGQGNQGHQGRGEACAAPARD